MKKIAIALCCAGVLSLAIGDLWAACAPGQSAEVLWKGTWYPATVIKPVGDGKCKIHYDGYSDSWDEAVGPDRIRYNGDAPPPSEVMRHVPSSVPGF